MLTKARQANPDDHAALASTRKQLALVCAARGEDPELIASERHSRLPLVLITVGVLALLAVLVIWLSS